MTDLSEITILNTWPKNKRGRNHGQSETDTYKIWQGISKRCYNKNSQNYHLYGGRGIGVAERWLDYEKFLADMGERPSKEHTIERINHSGHYEPKNCRWATKLEQARNKRNNRIITVNGEARCLAEWIAVLGVSESTIKDRIYKLGWSEESAITKPVANRNWSLKGDQSTDSHC